jgi:transposase
MWRCPVDLIRYVVKAVVLEGLSVREVAAAHGVSRSWVYECLARYRAEGDHVVIQLRG